MSCMQDNKYMSRCIELALTGLGNTSPNPMVGSVIVFEDKIIGEGFHKKAGEPHAEVNAVNTVKDKSLLSKSTLYVNLEPCSHFGKTPPCTNMIVDLRIPNVVIGTKDTASHVSGRGIEILKNAGINVKLGVLEKESRALNKRFFTFHEEKRPYIILKWAETSDGFLDIDPELKNEIKPTWITNNLAKTLVHKWRTEEDSILVGTNTVISDNPELTARLWKGKNPIRFVIDENLQLSRNFSIFNNHAKTLIIADKKRLPEKINIENENIGIEFVDFSTDFTNQLSSIFVKNKIQSLIIEGGSKTLQYFIDHNYWDEARIFTGPRKFEKGVKAPELDKSNTFSEMIGDSNLFFVQRMKSIC